MVINLHGKANRYVAETADQVRSEFPTLEVTTAVINDTPAEVLVGEAERLDARLIVVGNKRVQGPTRILGSVARTTAANASCDIYVVNTRHA
jgi:nucleotide-binding universal stress UspA family protein